MLKTSTPAAPTLRAWGIILSIFTNGLLSTVREDLSTPILGIFNWQMEAWERNTPDNGYERGDKS